MDPSGNVCVTGYSDNGSNFDYATIKYDPNGNQLWAQRYNGPGNGFDEAGAIALDSSGNVYVTGFAFNGVSDDITTIKYDTAGNQLWVLNYDGYEANAITVDATGSIYVSGVSSDSMGNPNFATIKYGSTNHPPVANAGPDLNPTVPHDGDPTTNTASFTLNGSGTDPDGDNLTYAWYEGANLLSTNQSFSQPRPAGTYTFTLVVSDGNGGSDSDQVRVTVNPEPNAAPVASNMSVPLDQGTSKSITLDLVDPDGDNLVVYVSSPAHGTLSFGSGDSVVYTPNAGYYGTDSFNFLAYDPYGAVSNTATVSLTVNHVNHAPVAKNQSVSTHNATNITLTATDVDGDKLTYAVVNSPSHGKLTGTAPNLTYTPAANYSGPDSFTFKANDGQADSNVATVSINIINTSPTAVNDSATTRKATAVTLNVLANDSDADGDTLTVSSVTQPANGTVVKNANNTLTFTPAKNFLGTTSFTYIINDGHGGSASATVTVSVTK